MKGDISFATRQYWAATGDTKWLYGENYSFPLEVIVKDENLNEFFIAFILLLFTAVDKWMQFHQRNGSVLGQSGRI